MSNFASNLVPTILLAKAFITQHSFAGNALGLHDFCINCLHLVLITKSP